MFSVKAEAPLPGEKLPEIKNEDGLEEQWAVKAFQHAETYMKLVKAVPNPTTLRLTRHDDEIYSRFREEFPDMKVDVIEEDAMKSQEGKEIWRPFLMSWEETINDYNLLTLLRIDASKGYTEENTTVVPRVQFYCVEIARLREGFNNKIES